MAVEKTHCGEILRGGSQQHSPTTTATPPPISSQFDALNPAPQPLLAHEFQCVFDDACRQFQIATQLMPMSRLDREERLQMRQRGAAYAHRPYPAVFFLYKPESRAITNGAMFTILGAASRKKSILGFPLGWSPQLEGHRSSNNNHHRHHHRHLQQPPTRNPQHRHRK